VPKGTKKGCDTYYEPLFRKATKHSLRRGGIRRRDGVGVLGWMQNKTFSCGEPRVGTAPCQVVRRH